MTPPISTPNPRVSVEVVRDCTCAETMSTLDWRGCEGRRYGDGVRKYPPETGRDWVGSRKGSSSDHRGDPLRDVRTSVVGLPTRPSERKTVRGMRDPTRTVTGGRNGTPPSHTPLGVTGDGGSDRREESGRSEGVHAIHLRPVRTSRSDRERDGKTTLHRDREEILSRWEQ